MLRQLAAELGIALRDIRALLLDPVDLRGLPFVQGWPVAVGNTGLSSSGRRGPLPAIAIQTVPPRRGCQHPCGTGSFTSTLRWTCKNGASGRSRRVSGPKSSPSFVFGVAECLKRARLRKHVHGQSVGSTPHRRCYSVLRKAISARLSSAERSRPNGCPFTAYVFTP